MSKDCTYISLSSLKGRGWTESIIKRYALQHDKEAVNPYYRSAAPIKLYELHKIEAIEATEEFKELQSATLKRKEAAKKAAETKLQAMKDYVHSIEIQMPKMSREQVFRKAVAHYNGLWECRGRDDKYISDYRALDNETLERITANMIRHSMTYYADVLGRCFGKVGIDYAHDYLRAKINQMVHDTYFKKVA